MRQLLLVSSSYVHGHGYLEYCEDDIRDLLGDRRRLLFIPYALHDQVAYAIKVRERFAKIGYAIDSINDAEDPRVAVDHAEAVFVGGGNTFRLLKGLYDRDLLAPIRRRVAHGMPYLGTSAGSNMACPSIRTTNDMPIVQPPSFEALGLVPYQINPHYLDPDPASTHQGETREKRLQEYLEANSIPVVALREGSHLRVDGDTTTLLGLKTARLFRKGQDPVELPPGRIAV